MKLQTRKSVIRLTVLVTLFVQVMATLLVLLVFPIGMWRYQITFVTVATLLLCTPVAFVLVDKIWQNAQLSAELRRLLNRDRLSGAASRDYFFEYMAENPGLEGVVLMVDVDHFKRINDTHGHLVGDEVIRSVSAALRQAVRDDDIVCRFGGEEFVVFLRANAAEDGYAVAERARRYIASICIPEHELQVTASIGVARKSQADIIDHVIHRADEALYTAKSDGRDRTVLATETAQPADDVAA